MKSSGSSSATPKAGATPPPQPRDTPSRRSSFALTGPSVTLDPRTHAVRTDLADVRLADQVFAPHYAAPMATLVERAVPLHADRGGGEILAELAIGDAFEVLELAGELAWGSAPGIGLVGFVDRHALERA